MAVAALALVGCKTRGEEVKERVDKALTGVSSDEQAIGAVSQTLWGKDTYDYAIKVLPFDGGGHRVDIVATRTNSDTLLSSAGSMKATAPANRSPGKASTVACTSWPTRTRSIWFS